MMRERMRERMGERMGEKERERESGGPVVLEEGDDRLHVVGKVT